MKAAFNPLYWTTSTSCLVVKQRMSQEMLHNQADLISMGVSMGECSSWS
nr:MAG TPA: hypothetical protein [Bacteriophage sp.]